MAEDWLYQHASKPEHIELGLARIREVLRRLNLSDPNYQVITVAGTNGKGSTVEYLNSMLLAGEYSVGKFTSPHLRRFNERIVVNNKEVDDQELLAAFAKIQNAADDIHLTYFEYATLAAIYIFAQRNVDVAVLEVGLGGRLDASNAIDADVAVITNIDVDHQEWLGSDIEVIGREKAGIMRKDSLAILAEKDMPKSLHLVAEEVGANVLQLGTDYQLDNACWYIHSDYSEEALDLLPAMPIFQQRNLSAAIAALYFAEFKLTQRALDFAMLQGAPLGRMQRIKQKRNEFWLLDVAHNPASMRKFCEHLETMRAEPEPKFNVVFGMLADKEYEQCVELLRPYIDNWFVAPLDSPRSLSRSDLETLFNGLKVDVCVDIATACEQAKQQSVPNTRANPILVCGSFYTVADALQYLD